MNRVAAYAVLIVVACVGLVVIFTVLSGPRSSWSWVFVIALLALCVAAVRSSRRHL